MRDVQRYAIMFVAVYRWRLRAGSEAAFAEGWRRITDHAIAACGSGGSALFQNDDGTWVAIARWPDREARQRCFAGDPLDAEASRMMSDAIEETLPSMELECVDDRWVAPSGSIL